jgi:predicted RNA binding protein YcfA (HicA-like mRNA interferase family)
MKFSELYRLLEKNGWVKKKGKKHSKYVNPSNPSTFISVGRHPSQEVPTGTLDDILKKAGLK